MTIITHDHTRTYNPVTCTSWCTYGDGHPDPLLATDQTCMSGHHPTIETRTADIGAYAMHRHADDTAAVAVFLMPHHGHGCEERLTLAQARALAGQILSCCDLLDGGAR